jgi:hypothetical protein
MSFAHIGLDALHRAQVISARPIICPVSGTILMSGTQ